MSIQQLEIILQDTVNVLEKKLRDDLELVVTEAQFTPDILYRAIIDQLEFTYAEDRKGVRERKFPAYYKIMGSKNKNKKDAFINLIKNKVNMAMKELHSSYLRLTAQNISIRVNPKKFNPRNPSFTVTTRLSNKNKALATRDLGNRILTVGTFQTIKDGYSEIMNSLWVEITAELKKEVTLPLSKKQEEALSSSSGFDLEHNIVTGSSVSQREISNAKTELINALRKSKYYSASQEKTFLEALGLEVFLKYAANKFLHKVEVHLGSRSKNRSQAYLEKEEKNTVRQALQNALQNKITEDYKQAANWGGSDSRIDVEKKKVIEVFKKTLKKNKYVRSIKTINTKLELSKRTSKKVTISTKKPKIVKEQINYNLPIKSKTLQTPNATQPTLNLNALKAQINARLSMTVIKNMGTPALENRTGRFARSVQVTDVTQTSKGFPSIGYTYQKYPYQTFEPGFKQGSTQRDPRTLIDRSIREIASELLVGRFYTRRV